MHSSNRSQYGASVKYRINGKTTNCNVCGSYCGSNKFSPGIEFMCILLLDNIVNISMDTKNSIGFDKLYTEKTAVYIK